MAPNRRVTPHRSSLPVLAVAFGPALLLGFGASAVAAEPGSAEGYRLRGNALADASKLTEALAEYRKACDLGDPKGCFNLGLLETRGEGVEASCSTGAAHFLKACRGGFGRACLALASVPQGCRVGAKFPSVREAYAEACFGGRRLPAGPEVNARSAARARPGRSRAVF